MKKFHLKSIIILIVGLVLVLMGLYYNGNNKNSNNPSVTPTPTPIEDSSKPYSGIYSLDGVNVYIYQASETEILFAINESSYDKGTIDNGKASVIIFDDGIGITYTLEKKDKNLEVVSDGNQIKNGLYQRVNYYSLENFYELILGSKELFNSNYNGKYVKDNITLYMFQTDEKEVEVIIDGGDNTFKTAFNIIEDNLLESQSSEETNSITIKDDGIVFKTSSLDETPVSNIFDGNYTKEGNIKMEDILLNRVTYLN